MIINRTNFTVKSTLTHVFIKDSLKQLKWLHLQSRSLEKFSLSQKRLLNGKIKLKGIATILGSPLI